MGMIKMSIISKILKKIGELIKKRRRGKSS